MKKFLTLLFAVMICVSLTACGNSKSGSKGGNTLTCTKESTDDEGYKTTDKYVLTYNGKDIVTKVENISIAEMDKSMIDLTVSLSSMVTGMFKDIKGIDMEITKEGDNKVKTVTTVDFAKLDVEKLKGLMGDSEDDSFYTAKDLTVKEFKSQNLEGYSCK